jgi:hypothetical protein
VEGERKSVVGVEVGKMNQGQEFLRVEIKAIGWEATVKNPFSV